MSSSRPFDVTLLTTAHDVADARLHREVEAFIRVGLDVEVIAHGDPRHAPRGATLSSLGFRRSRLRRLALTSVAPRRSGGAVLMVLDPELIISARWWAIVRRQGFVVDLHEDYGDVSRDRPWTRGLSGVAVRAVLRLVLRAAQRADLTAVADVHLPPLTARHRIVTRNLPGARSAARTRDATPRAVYVGDVRPSRGLWTMLETVQTAPMWTLDVVGRISEVSTDVVERRVRELGIDDRVTFHGLLPPERTWQIVDGAWCGLALLADTPAYRAAVPAKVYDYLAAGLAILATPLPRVEVLLRETGAGEVVSSAAEAASTLNRWSSEPAVLDVYRDAACRWAKRNLSGPNEFDDLARAVAALTESRGDRDGRR